MPVVESNSLSAPAKIRAFSQWYNSCVCESECMWVRVYVCMTRSIRTLSAGLIGSNEFLCWGGSCCWRGLWGSCLAASPTTTWQKSFINTTFPCPIKKEVYSITLSLSVHVCVYACTCLNSTAAKLFICTFLFPVRLSCSVCMRAELVKRSVGGLGVAALSTHIFSHSEALSQFHL